MKEDIGPQNRTMSEVHVSIGRSSLWWSGHGHLRPLTATHGELKGGYSSGYIMTDDLKFKRNVAKKYEMVVFPAAKGAFIVDLTGT
jgi:hypothetical protein